MDIEKFKGNPSGQLDQIQFQIGDLQVPEWAFVPDPLSTDFVLPDELWPLLADAKAELARLDGVGRHLPDQDILLSPLQQREAITSSSLEGTFATAEQLLLYGMDQREPSSDKDPVNDWREVHNYGRALTLGRDHLDDGYPISLLLIRQLHEKLVSGVRGADQTPGKFRERQVHIGSTRRFVPPPPIKVPQCLEQLENYLSTDSDLDPLVRSFLVHYQFEAIHPFNDGNGRVGRLLLSLMIYKWCELRGPWLYLSPFFEQYRDEYIDSLFKVSTDSNWAGWIELCLRATIEQAIDSIVRIDRLVEKRAIYHQKTAEIDHAGRLHPIIEGLFGQPIIRVTGIAQKYGISYPTAKSDIDKLTGLGILQKLDDIYPMAFFAPEIWRIAYEPIRASEGQ